MEIEFRLHRREHCLRANKRMKRWPAAVFWLTVGQFPIFLMAAPPSNSLSCCKSPTASAQYQLLKQLLYCQRADIAPSQQTNVEEYLSQGVEAAEDKDIEWKKRGGSKQKEWMNHFKNGNLMTVKQLIKLADTGTVCVCVCVRVRAHVCACTVCLSLREYSHSKSRLWD